MTSIPLRAAALVPAILLAACGGREAGEVAGDPGIVPAAPAFVVFTSAEFGPRSVSAVIEDGSAPEIAISAPGADTTFVAPLPGRRALLAEHADDGSITAILSAVAETGARETLGSFPAGTYTGVARALADGDRVVVSLRRAAGGDVVVLRSGAAPSVLAASADLVAVAAGRAAILAGGDLRSVDLDGGAAIPLGGGDGRDVVAGVRGDRILLTLHAGQASDVRLTTLDGSVRADAGDPALAEVAFALTDTDRIVFTRQAPEGRALLSTAITGHQEREIAPADLDVHPLSALPGGQVVFGSASGALLAGSAEGGIPRVLDPAAGDKARVGGAHDGRLVYVTGGNGWPALRAARLDGGGVVSLCDDPPLRPIFSGISPDGRVVYYRTIAGFHEGGRLRSVKLDGTDSRDVGSAATGAGDQPIPGGPDDQDFEVITPSGRVILESEFEANGGGSQLLAGAAGTSAARLLTTAGRVRFAAILP